VEGLEQSHMVHVVEAPALHLPNAFQDLERTCIAGVQLALGPVLEGVSRPVEKTKPDPMTHRKLQHAVVTVVVVLGELASLEEALADVGHEGITVAKHGVGRLSLSSSSGVRQDGRQGPAIHFLEGHCAERRVEGGVVAVLRPRKPVHQGSRAISLGAPQVHGDHLISDLRLAICLGGGTPC